MEVLRLWHFIIQNNTLNGVQNTTSHLTKTVLRKNHSFLGSYIIEFKEHEVTNEDVWLTVLTPTL